jgi:hypothetical protein
MGPSHDRDATGIAAACTTGLSTVHPAGPASLSAGK